MENSKNKLDPVKPESSEPVVQPLTHDELMALPIAVVLERAAKLVADITNSETGVTRAERRGLTPHTVLGIEPGMI